MKRKASYALSNQHGFSVIELVIVVLMLLTLTGISLFYLSSHQKLYRPDDQALKLVDLIQEARQRSISQRETMRVEINVTTNTARLIDENTFPLPDTVGNDQVLKAISLFESNEVKVGPRPAQIGYNPPEPFFPVPNCVFKPSVYPSSITNSVCTIRFQSDGTVVDAGNNAVGAGAVQTGVTLHIWSPNKINTNNSDQARAITILGPTGVMRLWEFDASLAAANKWKDSRRSGSY